MKERLMSCTVKCTSKSMLTNWKLLSKKQDALFVTNTTYE